MYVPYHYSGIASFRFAPSKVENEGAFQYGYQAACEMVSDGAYPTETPITEFYVHLLASAAVNALGILERDRRSWLASYEEGYKERLGEYIVLGKVVIQYWNRGGRFGVAYTPDRCAEQLQALGGIAEGAHYGINSTHERFAPPDRSWLFPASAWEAVTQYLIKEYEQEKQTQKTADFDLEAWYNDLLEEATDLMGERQMEITPESLASYMREEYEQSFTDDEAREWLESRDWYKPERGYLKLKSYVAGLNLAIPAGVDVRTRIGGKWLPVIRQITILKEEKRLLLWVLEAGRERQEKVPAYQAFSVEFADLPNELRAEGWMEEKK